MSTQINAIDLSKLRNSEFIQLHKDLLNLVHLNDETVLKCKPQYDVLASAITVIEAIFKRIKVVILHLLLRLWMYAEILL